MVSWATCGSGAKKRPRLETGIRFCGECGVPVEGPSTPGPAPTTSSGIGLSDNGASTLAYAFGFITGIVFLVLEPYNRSKTVRFHALHSIFFNVAWIALYVFVAIQLAWVLRPFVGSPELEVSFFRAEAWSNAYVVIVRDVLGFGG